MQTDSIGVAGPKLTLARRTKVDRKQLEQSHSLGRGTVTPADARAFLNSAQRSHPEPRLFDAISRRKRVYLSFAVLGSLVYLYASMMPFGFSIPTWPPRLMAIEPPSMAEQAQRFDVIINVLAFVPVGFLWSAAVTPTSGKTRSTSAWTTFWRSALVCLGLAILGEASQLLIPPRIASIWDVLALEAGSLIGCVVWIQTAASDATASCRRSQRIGDSLLPMTGLRTALSLGATLCGCVIVRISMHPAECFRIYQQRDLVAFGDLIHKSAISQDFLLVVGAIAILFGAWRIGSRSLAQKNNGPADAIGAETRDRIARKVNSANRQRVKRYAARS